MKPNASLDQLAAQSWQVLVIGAGPAGAWAAAQLAGAGLRVLLADRATFPRAKVCGGCLSAAAVTRLNEAGLGPALRQIGAQPLGQVHWRGPGWEATIALPGGMALSRSVLDPLLIEFAQIRGATFCDACSAHMGATTPNGHRAVHLQRGGITRPIQVPLVLACDGLDGRLLTAESPWQIAGNSYFGVGAIVEAGGYCPGVIHMACGVGGYVGVVAVEAGRLNIAAALDPVLCQQLGGPQRMISSLLSQADMPPPPLGNAPWRGTGRLTRRRLPGAWRVLALGDAGGYIEPFTGEGMSWAMQSAEAVVPLALAAQERWCGDEPVRWNNILQAILGFEKRRCYWLGRWMRDPARWRDALLLAQHNTPLTTSMLGRWR